MAPPTDRSSILDVFENFFGTGIGSITPSALEALSVRRVEDLLEAIDQYLGAVSGETSLEGAATLDGFASPIILPHDRTLPRTTRRAKQVALAHIEVVFPVEEFDLAYRAHGSAHLVSFCEWLRANEALLRGHVFTLP